ncbi:MAG: acetyl-CoA carboxylase carboxyl transferase subunit beta, partial [Oscillospiraceae bacterium]|nr:acetyl-CoA carboxylase carboxyl transferase subunit beta [Oscillospiraceae bacterium]
MIQPYERVKLARDSKRPGATEYIAELFRDFFEFHGDRAYSDDSAVICGVAEFDTLSARGAIPVSIAATCRGNTIEERVRRNFGMAQPDGYRKFQ